MAIASNLLREGLDFANPIVTFKIADFDQPNLEDTIPDCLTDYKRIASYNWFGKPEKQVIIVPGAPKRLVKWNGGQLEKDAEDEQTYYGRRRSIHEHHYMSSPYPMEALFQAIILCNEDSGTNVNFQDFDIVTDRNNLRKLGCSQKAGSGVSWVPKK